MLSKSFRETQIKWMEEMVLNKNNLCDTTFIVGKNQQKLYGLRALLANISPVFRAQLYGSFKEGNMNCTIEYPTISYDVFECIIRTSFGLDPNINEYTAVPLIQTSHMLQIPILQQECQYFLQHCIDENNVLFLLNSAYCLNSLDENLYLKCRSIILQSSNKIILNQGFYSLHYDLMIDILSNDHFEAKEESIWNSLLIWANNIKTKSLIFPKKNKNILLKLKQQSQVFIVNVSDPNKSDNNISDPDIVDDDNKSDNDFSDIDDDNKSDDNDAPIQKDTIKSILKAIIPYVRFTLMNKKYFIENCCKYLTRKQSESVLIFFILNSKSIFNQSLRKPYISFNIISSSCELDSAQKLPDLKQDALFCSQPININNGYQWFIIDILFIGIIKTIEIQNRYSDKDTVKSFKLQISSDKAKYDINDNNWIDVDKFQSNKSSTWQKFNVNVTNKSKKSRYWRFVLMDTYGGYTCINHIKLTMQHG